jgi:hypothetical protein
MDARSDPRQLPTLPVLVDLELSRGHVMHATLFLSMTAAGREGPETLDDFLNTPRRLLPVHVEGRDDQKSELVSRDAIVLVRVMSEIAPRPDSGAEPAVDLVRIELSNGKTIDAAVQHPSGERLSEFFNSAPEFFSTTDEQGVAYINKRHIVSVSM